MQKPAWCRRPEGPALQFFIVLILEMVKIRKFLKKFYVCGLCFEMGAPLCGPGVVPILPVSCRSFLRSSLCSHHPWGHLNLPPTPGKSLQATSYCFAKCSGFLVLASSSSLCKTASLSAFYLHLHLAADETQTKQQSALHGEEVGGSGGRATGFSPLASPGGASGGKCKEGSGWGGCPIPFRRWSPSPSAVGPPAAVPSLAWGSLPAILPAEQGLWPHPGGKCMGPGAPPGDPSLRQVPIRSRKVCMTRVSLLATSPLPQPKSHIYSQFSSV